MKFNHDANRLNPRYFDTVVEMLKVNLGFVELRRTERSIWLRQPGANVDLQFSRSDTTNRDPDKPRSQVSFLSETPKAALDLPSSGLVDKESQLSPKLSRGRFSRDCRGPA